MRTLGEQWVELGADGKEHMYKCVERRGILMHDCAGCFFNSHTGQCTYHSQDCPIGDVEDAYIKDLGILKDGMLPCPFCGEYPMLYSDERIGYKKTYTVHFYGHKCSEKGIRLVTEEFNTEQEAKDAWNRRS